MFSSTKYDAVKRCSLFTLCMSLLFILPSISDAQAINLPVDTTVVTTHKITINGETVPYKAIVGMLPVYKDSAIVAAVQYVYYKCTDVKNESKRPIIFSFNGGPGTASLWMQLGYTSPKRLKVSPEGWPVQPYGVVDNHHSILDVTDIVYVNPVNTGFSRILNNGKKKYFFGVKEDINYLADWIDLFISRYGRWLSPKFLIGESYGTTRVSGLAGELQSSHNIFLDGVILQGQCGIGEVGLRDSRLGEALKLPYYASTAWYFKQLSPNLQNKKLSELYPKVEEFTINKLLPALARGGSISDTQKQAIAQQVANYSGLSKQFVLNYNLAVPTSAFWKELLRDQGKTIGRLDSRYVGIDSKNAGSRPEYNAELKSWENAFAPAMNHYIREELGFNPDLQYYVFGPVHPWDRSNNRYHSVGDRLRQAMASNPALNVLDQNGYFDGACDAFTAKYALQQMDANGELAGRIHFKIYKSGHMLYIRKKSMIKGNNDIRQFIKKSVPKPGQPIKYNDVERVDLDG